MRKRAQTSVFFFVRAFVVSTLIFVLVFADVLHFTSLGLFDAPARAEAATGDFSIYTETSGTESVTTAGQSVTWDTVDVEGSSITLQSDDASIDLADGGKYLVLYNVWTQVGTSTGNDRRSFETYLSLDGSPIEYGRAAGYIRDASAEDEESYAAGGAIIDASPGENLTVHVRRDDTNTGAGSNIRPSTNGVNVLKLNDTFDYLRIHQSTRSADISGNTSFTDVVFDTADEVDSTSFGFTASSTSSNITLKGAAGKKFLITYNIRLNQDGGSTNRQNYEGRLSLDGVEIPGTRSTTYIRGNPNAHGTINGTIVYTGIIEKTSSSNQVLNVEMRRESVNSGTTDIVADETSFSAVALPESVNYISLTSTSSAQTLAVSRTPFNWNEQLSISTSSYTHSTTTNNSRITFNTSGNYLFFSTAYSERTSSSDRNVPRIEWRLDGTSVLDYGGHGSFNRGVETGGGNSFTGGSSGGLILNGITAAQYLEIVHSDETGDSPNATFEPHRIAVQGVDLASLSQINTTVSFTGDQQATTSPSVTNHQVGGTFVITENTGARNITNIILSEDGTIDAANDLSNIKLYYDLDTTNPYDCSSESYGGGEAQFGVTDVNGFTGANGTVSYTDSVSISTTQTFCGYVVLDIGSGAYNAETLNIHISDPSSDVITTGGGSVGPTISVGDGSATVIEDAEITLAHYHWRNDDGTETGASSATGGVEDTPALSFSTTTPQRLRMSAYAAGSGSQEVRLRLEYAEKSTVCSAATGWTEVGSVSAAWDLFDSSHFTNGADTTNIAIAAGGVSDPATLFETPNGALLDTTAETGALTLSEGVIQQVGEYGTVTNTNGATTTVNLTQTYTNPVVVASVRYNRTTEAFRTARVTRKTSTSFDILTYDDGGDATGSTVVDYLVMEAGVWDIQDGIGTRQVVATTTKNITYVEGGGAYADPGSHTLRSWESAFSGTPAVIATISSYNSTDWMMPHLSDGTTREALPTSTGYGVYLGRSHLATASYTEDIDVIAMDQGHGTNNGVEFDAVVGPDGVVTHVPATVNFSGTFSTAPGVTLVMQGFEDGGNGATALRHTGTSITTTGLSAAVDEEGNPTDRNHTDEPILVIAFEGSSGGLYTNTLVNDNFVEVEYAIQATENSLEGVGYCFRLSDAGVALRNYDVYAEATLNADVAVSATGTQIATVNAGSVNNYFGGSFIISDNVATRTVESITVTETGSINASTNLTNIALYYDLDTSLPYDCVSESYNGTEPQYGSTDSNGFSGANGTSTFTGSVEIGTTSSMCVYVIADVGAGSGDGDTVDFTIFNPSSDVTVSAGSVGPGSSVALTGSTTVQAARLTQYGYHWRNNNGDETDGGGGATSLGGDENTSVIGVQRGSVSRLRLLIDNQGGATSTATQYRLEYGTKLTSCAEVSVWQDVDVGLAFHMASTSQLIDGNDTTNIATSSGGITDPSGKSFLSSNGGQKEDDSQTAAILLDTDEFVELEYALFLTSQSGYDTTYCFRVTDAGTVLPSYSQYAELTTQEQQDFFIQRGTETITGTSTTLVAGSDYTAPNSGNSAFIRITNTVMTGAGGTAGAQDTPDDLFAFIADPENLESSVTIVRPSTADDNTQVSWEIIEYVGLEGADNEMVVRDVGVVTYGGSALYATGTVVSGVSDDADVVVFITGQQNPDTGTDNYNAGFSISHWHATTSAPVFERGDADGVAAGVSYAVVEFVGANWAVQRVSHTYAVSGATEIEPIDPVNSLARAFLHTQKLAGDELFNLDEAGHEVWISSIGNISFQLESGATNPADHESVAWVIENVQNGDGAMTVYQSNGTISSGGGGNTAFLFGIGDTVNTTNASIWANNQSTGSGNFHPRAFLGVRIFSPTQYELYRSDDGQNQDFRVEVVEWPVAELSFRQNYYRLYVDNDEIDPVDPWPSGAVDLGENTAMTDLDEPLGFGERVRIRMTLFVNNASFVEQSKSFKLQYARQVSTCSAVGTWNDLGNTGSGAIWRGFDGTPVDGTEIATSTPAEGRLNISVSDVAGTYEEQNNSAVNPYTVAVGEDVEFDWLVENNGALEKSSYCFRMIESDGTELSGYDYYPTVRTSGYTPVSHNWRWYDDENNETPIVPLAAMNTAPANVEVGDVIKLRVLVDEIEGASGNNIKYNVQYSEYPDFRDGGVTLTATTSCAGGTFWCYADGIDVDNTFISTTTLPGADSCIGGVGNGCGTHNEAEGLIGPFDHAAFSSSEHEFTLQHDGARINTVYYFRLFDATNGVPVLASSTLPSVVTAGSNLTFTVSGVASSTATEGVVTDITTTPTELSYGLLPFGTEIDAAHRISVSTNASEGYQVFMYFDQLLTNGYGTTIENVTGTNAVPSGWLTGCAPEAPSCFGYHVGDDTLAGGSARFSPSDSYAGVSSILSEIMHSSVPVSNESHDIVYRIFVRVGQESGTYESGIRYIAVPVF